MRIRLVRRPGQPGTKDLVAQYGEQLICVRYRYDSIERKRYKTAEIIIETTTWNPTPSAETIVAIRVAFHEHKLQQRIREVGGIWNRNQQVWNLRYDHVVALGLRDRIIIPD